MERAAEQKLLRRHRPGHALPSVRVATVRVTPPRPLGRRERFAGRRAGGELHPAERAAGLPAALESRRQRAHHLAPDGAAHARDPGAGYRVGVLDGAGRFAVGDAKARGVRQGERQRLVPFVHHVVQHRHRDRLRGHARREGERAARGRVVRARRRRPVGGRIVDSRPALRRPVQRHREVQRRTGRFPDAGVGHRHRRPRGRRRRRRRDAGRAGGSLDGTVDEIAEHADPGGDLEGIPGAGGQAPEHDGPGRGREGLPVGLGIAALAVLPPPHDKLLDRERMLRRAEVPLHFHPGIVPVGGPLNQGHSVDALVRRRAAVGPRLPVRVGCRAVGRVGRDPDVVVGVRPEPRDPVGEGARPRHGGPAGVAKSGALTSGPPHPPLPPLDHVARRPLDDISRARPVPRHIEGRGDSGGGIRVGHDPAMGDLHDFRGGQLDIRAAPGLDGGDPEGVLRARGEALHRVPGGARTRDMAALGRAVALAARLPLHPILVGVGVGRPSHGNGVLLESVPGGHVPGPRRHARRFEGGAVAGAALLGHPDVVAGAGGEVDRVLAGVLARGMAADGRAVALAARLPLHQIAGDAAVVRRRPPRDQGGRGVGRNDPQPGHRRRRPRRVGRPARLGGVVSRFSRIEGRRFFSH